MFGYIVPDRPELKVRENELYKAYYCGLCHSIKHSAGNLPRFFLSYDFAFLAMLFSGIKTQTDKIILKKCIASPLRQKPVVENEDVLDYCAEMNAILFYYKLKDDARDEKNPLYYIASWIYGLKIKKLIKKYSQKSDIIYNEIKKLTVLEKSNTNDLDLSSGAFGRIMETLFDYELFTEEKRRALKWMGFNLGKWIYIIDAYDDIEKDRAKKRPNPFYEKDKEPEEIRVKQQERVKEYLLYCLEEVSAGYELLDINTNKSVLDNIIYSGLLKKTHERCTDNEKSV